MKTNEGFVTPLTVVSSFLILFFLLHQIQLLNTDRIALMEEQQIVLSESLVQMGTVDLMEVLKSSPVTEPQSGTFSYDDGTVSYTITVQEGNTLSITLMSETTEKRRSQVIMYYNQDTKTVTKWVEA
jgi:hypothetical protein